MNMETLDQRSPITEKDIKKLSNELEVAIPSEYIDFLLAKNGGQPTNCFSISDDGINWKFTVNCLFGIDSDMSLDILSMFANYCDRIPSELLPIAGDGVGNIICLGIEGEYYGRVYIWWFDKCVDENELPNFKNVDLISNTFNQFLAGFKG